MVVHGGELHDVRHGPQRVLPGADLALRCLVPEVLEEGVGQLARDPALGRVGDEVHRGSAVEVHPGS